MIPNEKIDYSMTRATKNHQADFFMNDKANKIYTAGSRFKTIQLARYRTVELYQL